MTKHEIPAEQRQPDAIIQTERLLSPEEVDALRAHVREHGLVDLPFNAKVRTPE